MKELREKHMKWIKSKDEEDKELLMTSCKTLKRVRHVYKPLYHLFPNIACLMKFDKGVQVDWEKTKRQSMDFPIPKYLDLSSIVIFFSLDVTGCKGILEIKFAIKGIKVPYRLFYLAMTQLL